MKKFLLTAVLAVIAAWTFAQERIAVFPFEDMDNVLTGNEAVLFYREFYDEFINRSVGRFSVVPRQDVERIINIETDLGDPEMHSVLIGTQILLSGYIDRVGNIIIISVSLYKYPELRQLPGGVYLRVTNKTELFDKIPELVQRIQDIIAGGEIGQSIPEELLYEIVDGRTVSRFRNAQ
jgi:TolB-like protein